MRIRFRLVVGIVLGTVSLSLALAARPAMAVESGEFAIQISPSPLVATVEPGKANILDLKIRNNGSQPEVLKIAPRKFSLDNNSQNLQIDDTQPADIASWISFNTPTFTIQPNQTSDIAVTVNVPKDAGFSYSLALIVSRTEQTHDLKTGRTLKGSVAIFTLLNVDRPDAVRELKLTSFKASSGVYDHLPVHFEIEFQNTGNTIVQPAGNVFIQRGKYDSAPIDTLAINDGDGYILPGHSRTITLDWNNGFQVERKVSDGGVQKTETVWDWSKVNSFRFGPYTAKLVAVYNDGRRDVPLEADTSFWVIPWLVLIGIIVVVGLIGIGLWTIVRNTIHKTTKSFNKNKPPDRRFTS